ncbi:MAG TPA: MauE/DoxX family redox-associated membrane protein [Herpetosiphonaceae bacterium]
MFGLVLTFPLFASAASYAWSRYFGAEERSPIGPQAHVLLIVAQLTIATWVASTWYPLPARIALALMYLALGSGAAYFKLTKGDVPCGCMGSQSEHPLTWRLVAADLLLACAALLSTREQVVFAPGSGLFLGFVMCLLGLLVTTGLPDALYALRGGQRAVERYRSWINGYKELLP